MKLPRSAYLRESKVNYNRTIFKFYFSKFDAVLHILFGIFLTLSRCKTYLLLTELSRSVWENLDRGRKYRPNAVRSVHTTEVKMFIMWRKQEQFNSFKHYLLRTFARKCSNIDFFPKILPLKDDELVMSEM